MAFIPSNNDNVAIFDIDTLKDLGTDLSEAYSNAQPFPHIVIDNFLDRRLVDLCLSGFPETADPDSQEYDRDQERFKKSYHPDYLTPELRALFYAFNARPFIRVIENITGIKQLIPDPYFVGGGFHEIGNGGHLSVHADFNHHKPMNLERRVNVLIYLNEDWKEEYGGQLELWTPDMSECVQSILPIANRCAIFTTTGDSMHGNPQLVAHPGGQTRKSIALYYYTATWDGTKQAKTTQFRARSGTDDKADWSVLFDQALRDLTPPIVARQVARLRHKLKG